MDASVDRARSDSITFVLLLLLALVLRIAVISGRPEELRQDRDAYLGIATGLAEGRGYSSPGSTQPTAYRPPLYPLLLASGLMAFPVSVVVIAINLIAGMLTVWLTERLGQRLNLGRSRFLAVGLVGVDPILLRYATQPMTESVCAFLAVLWLWSVVPGTISVEAKSRTSRFLSGVAFGLLVLCRPTFWPITIFWIPSFLASVRQFVSPQERNPRIKGLFSMLCSPLGTLIVVGPWLVRNWLVFGVPILTTTHGGYTLLLSNNLAFYHEVVEQPWGTVWQGQSLTNWQADIDSQIQHELGMGASEVERDRWCSRKARETIRSHPRRFAAATLQRIRSLWNTVPQGDAAEEATGTIVLAVGWYYTIVLSLAFVGLFLVARQGAYRSWLPLYALIVTVQLAHLVYWTNARMRAPLTPVISLFAAAALMTRHRDEESSQTDSAVSRAKVTSR